MKYEIKVDLSYQNSAHTQLINRVPDGSDVLEFGCSTGFVSKYLKEKGCKVTGVEINADEAQMAREFCDSVLVADIDKLDFKKDLSKKYDVITFGDVLEHLKEPEKVLEYVLGILKENGYVLASIPNIGFGYYRLQHLKGRFDYERTGILDKTHLRFFDHNQVFAMFESAGYYIKNIFRIKNEVSNVYVRDILKEIGIDDSDKSVGNIKDMLDFEVFQFFVTAYPASEKNALKLLRDKELDYIAQIKDVKEKMLVLQEKVSALEKINKYQKDLEEALEKQKTHIANLEATLISKDEYINELNAELQKIYNEINEL